MGRPISKENIQKLLIAALQTNGGFYINPPEKPKKHPKRKPQSKSQKRWYDSDFDEQDELPAITLKQISKEDWFRKAMSDYIKGRLATDPVFKLRHNIRTVIGFSIRNKGFKKSKSSEKILGCSISDFILYIQSKWKPWMNWDNYGNKTYDKSKMNNSWDLDHIIPISSAKTLDDVYRLNHYTNFQPLCSVVNRHVKVDNILN